MFCILMPVLLAPVIAILAWTQRQARKKGYLDGVVAPWKSGKPATVVSDIFWQVDLCVLLLIWCRN